MADNDHTWIRKVKDGNLQFLNQLTPAQRFQIGGVEAVELLRDLTEVCITPLFLHSACLCA
jgi:hypothetical protein